MDYRKENLIKKYKVPNEVINSFEHSPQKALNDYTATGVLMALENILDKYKIPREEKKKIIKALNNGVDHLGLREKNTYGETIEDRGSQITFSALGQEAPVEEKKKW